MKAKPDSFNFASSGAGSTQHLAGEAFKKVAGVSMTHIPYKGSSQAHADMLSGQAQLMFDTTSSAIGQIKGGKLCALAVTSPRRSPELADVPTLAEAGFPGLDMATWYGVFAPSGTPKDVVARLHDEIMNALKLPDVQKRIAGLAGEPGRMSVAEFAELNRADYERYGKLIDGIVTMYHDQGQIAMKLMGFERGVTVQGGLPVAITTPAHGTAYDIAGRGIANVQAMSNALAIAARMGAASH
jgi:tripartite-type tricarboxylate transporter receptor subunit TctC